MDNRILASHWSARLQEALYALTRIFDWPEDQHKQNGGDDLPAVLDGSQALRGSTWSMDSRGLDILPGSPEEEGMIPIVCGGPGGMVTYITLPVPEWDW